MSQVLNGSNLTIDTLVQIARQQSAVSISADAKQKLQASRAVVERYINENKPAYGLTTGLGPSVTYRLSTAELADFSRQTVRGRANAVGPPLPREQVRAVMAVRLNGLLQGGAGVSPALAEQLLACLNAGLHPHIPSIGSVGMSDLCQLAHMGLALMGEGTMEYRGERLPAQQALARCDLAPLILGPKDGLALCSNSAVSAAQAALAWHDAQRVLQLGQIAGALSLEGFRANLSPFDERAVAARPAPGQQRAAHTVLTILRGSALNTPGTARRLQDPTSFRCIPQVHGSLYAALDFALPFIDAELNGAADNPLVLSDDDDIISTGNFHTSGLGLALETLGQALAQLAGLSVSRCAALLKERLSGLPRNLSPQGGSRSGFAPLLKTADALLAEIRHAALPAPLEQRWSADGVEDDLSAAPLAGRKLLAMLESLQLLLSIELLIASQAMELAAISAPGEGAAAAYRFIRTQVERLNEDRALGPDVERLAGQLLTEKGLLASVATVCPSI